MQGSTRYLRPDDVRRNAKLPAAERERLAHRFLEMLQTETRFVSPEPNLRTRAAINQGTKRGTIVGELLRSGMQFKGFPLSVLMMHGNRVLHGKIGISRARYAATVGIMATLFGAVSMQEKAIAKGQDPRPMTTPEFWVAAMLQGGALGIFGDFLFADSNRFGGGLVATSAGPLAGTAEDLWRLTQGTLVKKVKGDDSNFGRELVRFLKMNTPVSSIWYVRKAFEGIVWDNLQRLVDPDFDRANRRMMQRAERDYQTGFWWEPGEALPSRGPDWDNAVAEVSR